MKHFGGIRRCRVRLSLARARPVLQAAFAAQIRSRPKPRTPVPRASPLRAVRARRRGLCADRLEDGRALLRYDTRPADGAISGRPEASTMLSRCGIGSGSRSRLTISVFGIA